LGTGLFLYSEYYTTQGTKLTNQVILAVDQGTTNIKVVSAGV
jgi:hypothetical protein